jgi:acyl-CoA reductase-like NAD-dependent aldehyde dehydrogenase
MEAFRNSFPAGVINVVYGRGEVASPIMASRKPYLSNWKQ